MSDNPLLNRPQNTDLDIIVTGEKPLSLLWEEFEINLGRFLLSLWRNVCAMIGFYTPHSPAPAHSSGGQSNTALIKLMQGIESEIKSRSEHVHYGYTAQEVADGLAFMANAHPSMRDLMPEQCSFTPINDDGFMFVLPVEEEE